MENKHAATVEYSYPGAFQTFGHYYFTCPCGVNGLPHVIVPEPGQSVASADKHARKAALRERNRHVNKARQFEKGSCDA